MADKINDEPGQRVQGLGDRVQWGHQPGPRITITGVPALIISDLLAGYNSKGRQPAFADQYALAIGQQVLRTLPKAAEAAEGSGTASEARRGRTSEAGTANRVQGSGEEKGDQP